MARPKSKAVKRAPDSAEKPRLYTPEVFLLSGHLARMFVKRNPVVPRTIEIRGDQTLEDLHHAIFDAFGRWEEHM